VPREPSATRPAAGNDDRRAQTVTATQVQARLRKVLQDPSLSAERKAELKAQLEARLEGLRGARSGEPANDPPRPEGSGESRAGATEASRATDRTGASGVPERARNVTLSEALARLDRVLQDPSLTDEQLGELETQLEARLARLRRARTPAVEAESAEAAEPAPTTNVERRAQNVAATQARARLERQLRDPGLSAEDKAALQATFDARFAGLRQARSTAPSDGQRAWNVQGDPARERLARVLQDADLSDEQKARIQAHVEGRLASLRTPVRPEPARADAGEGRAAPAVARARALSARDRLAAVLADPNVDDATKAELAEAMRARFSSLRSGPPAGAAAPASEPAGERRPAQLAATKAWHGVTKLLATPDLPIATIANLRFLTERLDALRTAGARAPAEAPDEATRARVRSLLIDPSVPDDVKSDVRAVFGDPAAEAAPRAVDDEPPASERSGNDPELERRILEAQAEVERKLRASGAPEAQIDAQKAAVRQRFEAVEERVESSREEPPEGAVEPGSRRRRPEGGSEGGAG